MTSGWRATRDEIDAILGARHADPFALLGPHRVPGGGTVVRVFEPHAETVEVQAPDGAPLGGLECRDAAGFFEGLIAALPARYRLAGRNGGGRWIFDDVYAFGPVLGPLDDHLLVEGMHTALHRRLGAHATTHEGVAGVHFAVWAPHAERVSVVAVSLKKDGRRHPMRKRVDSGIWEIFLPGVAAGAAYKYEIRAADGAILPLKADPVGRASELRPSTASLVPDDAPVSWRDDAWIAARAGADARSAPMSIYEVHLGSWRRRADGTFMSYDELAGTLVPYAAGLGFTHLELLPVSEHPLDASWGYQPIGLFAPTRRFGDPKGFARFVDAAHRAGLGVILDWVPAHFPVDAHGLARFDGTALYEHPDPRRGFHPDWNTAIYDFGRRETVTLLASNALYWFEAFHVDGLRVDAVASMLYLDYSRRDGAWIPNARGGNTSDEAVGFLRHVNGLIAARHPGALTIAEESTAWPGVSRPAREGGLGFDFKWNMGWMHDTLAYMATDPVHRRFHHDKLTFGLLYAFAEDFVLPLSHDEVVHGKGTLLGRMPGDAWQKFANLRAYLAFMWGHPGKKLLFMGQEFGQGREWNFDAGLEWHLLGQAAHAGVRDLVRDLNRLHRSLPALHARDGRAEGFRWIVVDDDLQSVLAWLRLGGEGDREVAVICNFTPVPRHAYRIGLPRTGRWREILNTDARAYGGSGMGNAGEVTAVAHPAHGYPASAEVLVPPLAAIYLEADPA